MIKPKKLLKRSIALPVLAGVILFGSSASAMVATGVIQLPSKSVPTNPAPITDNIKPDSKGKISDEDQAKIDKNSQVVETRTNPDGTKVYILSSALDANGVYHGPDANGCWNFTMTGAHIPAEVKSVCNDADIQAFRSNYLARDAAASKPTQPTMTQPTATAPTTTPSSVPVPTPEVTPDPAATPTP